MKHFTSIISLLAFVFTATAFAADKPANRPAGVTLGPTVVVVDENNANWGFLAETGTPTGSFVLGPATPPLGTGSARFELPAGADGMLVGTQLHAGTRMADITAFRYSTYQNITPQAVALQFNIDYDDTDSTTSWQGRLVFEPSTIGTVQIATWQSWDALAGRWWSTGTPIVGDTSGAVLCPQATPCPWATVLGSYPNAAVQSGALAGILLKAGSGWPAGFDGNADSLRIATTTEDVIYNFETTVPVELMTFSVE